MKRVVLNTREVAMVRFILLISVILNVLAGPLQPRESRADGKVFAAGPAKVAIPDQEALIVWRDGVETLAIETRFVGPGHDFAWVVPLPAKPEISPGTTGMFPTLRAKFASRVVGRVPAYWFACVWIAACLLAAMTLTTSLKRIGMVFLALFVPLTLVLLPSLGKARGLSAADSAVNILERKMVGAFDVATVASSDPKALDQWLADHGFMMSPSAHPVIADYVSKGWVFACAKLRRDADTQEPSTPHPLVFKFEAKAPVYPLRLTAVENGDLTVDLYVFGPSRAAAEGFRLSRCADIEIAEPMLHRYSGIVETPITMSHETLAGLIGEGLVGTKLSATLSPDRMAKDAVITFVDGGSYWSEQYTRRAATQVGLNIGSGVMVCGIVLVALLMPRHIRTRRTFHRVLGVLALACIVGGAAAFTVPTIESTSRRDAILRWRDFEAVASELWSDVEDRRAAGGTVDEEWARATIRSKLSRADTEGRGPFKEGDGPGCYRFKITPEGGVVLRWYSDFGDECRYYE